MRRQALTKNALSGNKDAYVVKFNSAGLRIWGTFFGGTDAELCNDLAVDASSNVYMAGGTYSTSGISTSSTHQPTHGGNHDAYLVKFSGSGSRIWSTYYGDLGNDNGRSCAVDNSGNVYLVGNTNSTLNIASGGSHQSSLAGPNDIFFVKINENNGARKSASYFGGNGNDWSNKCLAYPMGILYFIGGGNSDSSIATKGTYKSERIGGWDGYLTKFQSCSHKTSIIEITSCGDYISPGGQMFDSTGIYLDDTLTTLGCDSHLTIHYTLKPLDYFIQPSDQVAGLRDSAVFYTAPTEPVTKTIWQTDLGFGWQTLQEAGQYRGTSTSNLRVLNVDMNNNNQHFRNILVKDGCSDTSTVAVLTVKDFTGLDPIQTHLGISISPNPTDGQINISFREDVGTVEVSIFNEMNQLLEQESIESGGDQKIEITGEAGLYFIQNSRTVGYTGSI